MKKYLFVLILIITALLPTACSQVQPKDVSEKDSPANEILNNMKKYQEIVERITNKKFKEAVRGKVQSEKEFKEFVGKELDTAFEGSGKYTELSLIKLGLLPKDYNLRRGLENLFLSQAGAYYDPKTKYMYILKTQLPPNEIETMLVHELTHALQDQYYDLEKLIKQADNTDKETAIKYLVEGEATYVMTIAQLEKMGMTFTTDSPMLEMAFDRMKHLTRKEMLDLAIANAEHLKETAPDVFNAVNELKKAPPYLFWTFNAPYLQGAYSIHKLVSFNNDQRNWETVSTLYQKPPVSTEQMIHIDKLSEPRDNPEPVLTPNLGDDWTIISENTLGELGFWILYSDYTNAKASEASAGWDGDKYMLFQHNKTKDIALYLSTVWDSDNDAYESFNAYQKIISKKYPSAELKNTEKSESGQVKYSYTSADNKLIILTLKGNTWYSLEDVPADTRLDRTGR